MQEKREPLYETTFASTRAVGCACAAVRAASKRSALEAADSPGTHPGRQNSFCKPSPLPHARVE